MFTLNCTGRLLVIDEPIVMGIINITPDSFYENSRNQSVQQVVDTAGKMLDAGATILDAGGQSTRPGSQHMTATEEMDRVLPAIEAIHQHVGEAYISVDTYYASVAKAAVKAGACIVNDIGGGTLDEAMLTTVGTLQCPYICMHIAGTPQTMQQHANYTVVALTVLDYFIEKQEICRLAGINDVIIDPGFGFAKTIAHNFELLKKLTTLSILEKPILTGVSRKGMVYKTFGTAANEALNGTTVLNTIALMNGATILRVHDVKEAVEAIKLFLEYRRC